MKKICVLLSFAVVAVCLFLGLLSGCSEETTRPTITRLSTSHECGVAPLAVEFRAFASGGTHFDQPTSGNNFLEFAWDFGDGNTSTAALTYHEYEMPGDYRVNVTATDAEGLTATKSTDIHVRSNTFNIEAIRTPAEYRVAANRIVHFKYDVSACGIADDDPTRFHHFVPVWTLLDGMTVRSHEFMIRMPGYAVTDTVILNVNYYSASEVLADTLYIDVFEQGHHGDPMIDPGDGKNN